MTVHRLTTKSFRALIFSAFLSSSSLLSILPALANENSAPGGVEIKNQATAQFTDDADNTTQQIVSNTVKVSVLEIAGISATGGGVKDADKAYRTGTAYADFIVTNQGNDPTKFFIPGAPSKIEIKNGTTVKSYNATLDGNLTVVEYSASPYVAGTPGTVIDKNNIVPSAGAALDALTANAGTTALPNSGSIPAGGYVRVRVPIKVPFEAVATDVITVTLGNTVGTNTTNVAYAAGGDGTGDNDLYTKDNANNTLGSTITGEADGVPYNGDGTPGDNDTTKHRQEASATQTITVIDKFLKISGTVFNDINKDGTKATSGEPGTNGVFGTNKTKINVILVDTDTTTVLASKELEATDNGFYEFSNIQTATKYKVYLSETKYTSGSAPGVSIVGTKWVGTTPVNGTIDTAISKSGTVALADIVADLGIRQKANLVLVKRITGLWKASDVTPGGKLSTNPYDNSTSYTGVIDDTDSENDDAYDKTSNLHVMNWPTGVLKGAINGGPVAPGDQIEYTIYFINNQGADAKNVVLCDSIRGAQTLVTGTPKAQLGSTNLTATELATTPTDCQYSSGTTVIPGLTTSGGADNGAVKVTIPSTTSVVGATGQSLESDNSYGYFKFVTTVKP